MKERERERKSGDFIENRKVKGIFGPVLKLSLKTHAHARFLERRKERDFSDLDLRLKVTIIIDYLIN